MLKDKTICQFLNIKVEEGKPFIITHNGKDVYREYASGFWTRREFDNRGNVTYFDNSYGQWWKSVYDSKDNETYFENSEGYWYTCEYDSNGRLTYTECSSGDWSEYEYDSKGNPIYYEDSSGYILDNRPKELTMDEIAEKFGIPVDQMKIKKD